MIALFELHVPRYPKMTGWTRLPSVLYANEMAINWPFNIRSLPLRATEVPNLVNFQLDIWSSMGQGVVLLCRASANSFR